MTRTAKMLVGMALAYAGFVAFDVKVEAGGGDGFCCQEGWQCEGELLCCPYDKLGAYPCNPAENGYKDYCAKACKQA